MADCIIDTNVLLVASAAHPYSPFDDTHVAAMERQIVFDWLAAFRNDDRCLVLDRMFKIYEEYQNQMTGQVYGLQVIHEKMQTAFRQVDIHYLADCMAEVPAEFDALDRSDRKFLAVALADEGHSTVVNATDTDWFAIEEECDAHAVVVEQLIEAWLRKGMCE
jgi:hypothetical protein